MLNSTIASCSGPPPSRCGTSLAGGVGTIYGAIIGAVVMQSLQTGMVLIGFDAALQNIVVGSVLVLAVYLDIIYRKRAK